MVAVASNTLSDNLEPRELMQVQVGYTLVQSVGFINQTARGEL
jgi:hypothetical protein